MKKLITKIAIAGTLLSPLAFALPALAGHNADGLAGYWAFDDGVVISTADTSGHGNNATLTNGPTFDSGNKAPIPGNVSSIMFDGSNDFLNVPHDADLNVDQATLSAWVYMASDISSGTKNIVRKGHFGNRVFGLDIDGGTKKIRGFVVLGATGGAANVVSGGTALSTGAWHHVAMTYDGTNVRVYVDGSLDGTSAVATGSISDNLLSIRIGGQSSADSGGALAFKGNIDEVRIYNTALDADEVAALHDYIFDIDSAGPPEAFNPVDTEHTVTATISPALAGIPVLFEIDGPNSAESGTAVTNGAGVASFIYVGTNAGVDEITACVDSNDENGCSDELISEEISKTWFLRHFVTGGGIIKESKKPAWTYGGMIGFNLDGNPVGQFQITDHTNKVSCHFDSFENLVFSGDPATSPDADDNTASFEATGSCSNGETPTITVMITDNAEPGSGADTIVVTEVSGADNVNLDNDSPYTLSGGNFQVHPPEGI